MIKDFMVSNYIDSWLRFRLIQTAMSEEFNPIVLHPVYSDEEVKMGKTIFAIEKERANELLLDFHGCIDGDLR